MKVRFYWYLWQYAPIERLRYWAWARWLGSQWVYPDITRDPHLDKR